jgi:SAM-dependent methyltransferase
VGGVAAAYDRVAYPGFAFHQTRPDRLAVIGRLHGMRPAPVGSCRVLELGCGDGVNLLTMAAALPGSEFVGVDAASKPVASGTALAQEAGLGNVRLLELDLEGLPGELGPFDYVVAHGIYSWVPPQTRSALLRACREYLAPQGIAFVSYNAYPGSYLRDMAREALEWHLRDVHDPSLRIQRARELMQLTVDADGGTRSARVLSEHMQALLAKNPNLLFHDDLAEVNTAVYFHEFASHAAAHGLQFLSEADLAESRGIELVPELAARLGRLASDRIEREQYTDIVKNRMFRETLLCHPDVELREDLDAAAVRSMAVSGAARPVSPEPRLDAGVEELFETREGARLATDAPLVKRVLVELHERRPEAIPVADLDADGEPDALCAALTRLYTGRLVELWTEPPATTMRAGPRPEASPLARAQAAAGREHASSLMHDSVALDPVGRRLLELLDGSRDRAALAAELSATLAEEGLAPVGPQFEGQLETALQGLAGLGLLVA